VINARRLSRRYFVRALSVRARDVAERRGIGIQRGATCSLPRLLCEIVRLWVTL
jgi:hypothetical protein